MTIKMRLADRRGFIKSLKYEDVHKANEQANGYHQWIIERIYGEEPSPCLRTKEKNQLRNGIMEVVRQQKVREEMHQ